MLKPRLLILDEALSGLDLVIQAQMTKLLLELQASLSIDLPFYYSRPSFGGTTGGSDCRDAARENCGIGYAWPTYFLKPSASIHDS